MKFLKKYYSIAIFTIVMLVFISFFAIAITELSLQFGKINKILDVVFIILASIAELFYIGILIKGWKEFLE